MTRRLGTASRKCALLSGLLLWQTAAALDPDKPFTQYVLDRWSVEEGFPQVSALQVVQDHQGYIWATTQSGLTRFDGVQFTNFNVQNTPELLTDYLQVLHVDRDGGLWIASARGLTLKDEEGFRVIADSSSELGPVHDLADGPAGSLWIASDNGLFHLTEQGLERKLTVPLYSLLASDTLWAGGNGLLYRFDAQGEARIPVAENIRIDHLASWQNALWLGTSAGLYRLDQDGQVRAVAEPAVLDELAIELLYVDRHNSLWVGSYPALARLAADGEVELIDRDVLGFRPWIIAAAEDHEGNLWLGSQTHSLIRLWDGWTRRYSTSRGLADPFVWSLAVDDQGAMWIGTNSGLARMVDGDIVNHLAGVELPDPAVYTLLVDGACVWLGTRGGMARYCDGVVDRPPGLAPLDGLQINVVERDAAGRLWLATSDGLYRYEDGELVRVPDFSGSGENRVRALLRDGDAWLVGTEGGLFRLEGQRRERLGAGTSLRDAFVTSLARLPGGRLGVGTLGRGLIVGSEAEGWLQLDQRWGIPDGGIFYLDVGNDGYLWIGGEVGAFRTHADQLPAAGTEPTMLPVQNLASSNQLVGSQPARCCNGAGGAKGLYHQGSYWFPTLDGVLQIEPAKIVRTAEQPRVVIEGVEARGQQIKPRAGRLELKPSQRDFSIRFTALTYQDPRNVMFRYRLVGYDEDWIWSGRRRTAFYTNLAPGEYEFEVVATSSAGRWSASPASVPLVLTPRLAETLWFRSLLIAVVATLAASIYGVRMRRARRTRQRLERLVGERTRALDEVNRLLIDANRKLEQASETDPLTGLKNRRFVLTRLASETAGSSALFSPSRMPMMVVVADIDRFKMVNDVHGHAAGDEILRQFTHLLTSQVRDCDAAVRWGGEEFLLLIGDTSAARAPVVLERLRSAVTEHRFHTADATLMRLTCSFGAATVMLPPGPVAERQRQWTLALELADRALYAVKDGGRDGWALLEPSQGARDPGGSIADLADQWLDSGQVRVHGSRESIRQALVMGPRSRGSVG